MLKALSLLTALLAFSLPAFAATSSETAAARYLAANMRNPQKIQQFMRQIPKGGDLHNHASGSTFAEKMVEYAASDNLCVNRTTFAVYENTACQSANLLNLAIQDAGFYDSLIDAWSMQHFSFNHGKESGHDHFFSAFGKFGEISHRHMGEILTEITDRAGSQNEKAC